MALSYAFGGNTGQSYEELQRRRLFAEAMMQRGASSQPKTAIEGINAAASSIMGALLQRKIGAQDAKNREAYNSQFGSLLGGQSQGAPYAASPATPSAFETPNPGGLPQSTIAAVDRVSPNIPHDFSKIEQTYGLPAGYLSQVAQIESRGNPNAQNPKSSAGGMFQFIDSTAKQYGLTDKTDPYASADAAARLAADNKAILTKALGREPTAGELYLAHQQGGGGAAALLSNPNAPAASIVGNAAINLNGGNASMTAGDFANQWTSKIDPRMVEAMGNPYATDAQRSALGALLEQQLAAKDPMKQLQLQKAQLEVQQMQNPQAQVPEMVTQRLMLAKMAGLKEGTPEWQSFMVTGNTIGRGANEFGLNPIYGTDEKGNVIVMQLGKDGTAVQTKLPDGVNPNLGIKSEEAARGTAIGKASGDAAAAVPGTQETVRMVKDQIQGLINDPYLPKMLGPVDSRLPNVSADAARVQGKIDQLQGGAFLQAYNILRGGGQITEVEGNKAQAAMLRMNTAQSVDDFKKALMDFQDAVDTGLAKLNATAGASGYGSTAPAQAAPTDGLTAEERAYLGLQ